LENFNDSEDINRSCENVTEHNKTWVKESLSLYELKLHKAWFDEEFSRLLDQKKLAKMQWLQDPNQNSEDDLNM